jgi:hypothetical protein
LAVLSGQARAHHPVMARKAGEQPADTDRAEALRLRRWRQTQFCELGFPLADARKLAKAPVDVGTARTLIGAGCPAKTAFRILI